MNERMLKLHLIEGANLSPRYQFPELEPSDYEPVSAIPFDKARAATDFKQWVHFYIHDRSFECVWHNPQQYLTLLSRFQGVLSTDFSIYRDMPIAVQIWNIYRNRVISYWLQSSGVNIIPNISWGDKRSFDFCFEGVPKQSTVSVSTNGCIRDKVDRYCFMKGLEKMIEVLEPQRVICYSSMPDDIFSRYYDTNTQFIHLPHYINRFKKEVSRG